MLPVYPRLLLEYQLLVCVASLQQLSLHRRLYCKMAFPTLIRHSCSALAFSGAGATVSLPLPISHISCPCRYDCMHMRQRLLSLSRSSIVLGVITCLALSPKNLVLDQSASQRCLAFSCRSQWMDGP